MQRLRAIFSPRDMTQGTPWKRIVEFAFPMLVGNIAQQLYASTDAVVVGRYVGDHALASVGSAGPILMFMIALFVGISTGAGILVSQAFGAKDREKLSTAIGNCITLTAISAGIIMVLGTLLARPVLQTLHTPPEIIEDAIAYLQIYFVGIAGFTFYNILSGVLRGLGDSFSALGFLLLTSGLNIALDLLFVIVFGWGVPGVAIATVISQMISVLMVYNCLKKHDPLFRLSFKGLKAERQIIVNMVGIGMPAGLQNSLISFSNLFVWRYISGFDAAAMAGVGAAQRIDRFIGLPCKAFGLALTTYISQNVGARHYDRLRKGFWYCMGLSLLYLFVTSSVIYVFADESVRLFNSEPDVVAVGISMMKTILPFYFLLAFREVCLGALRGYGDTRIPMLLSLLGMVVLRQIYLAVAMSVDYGIIHIYICYPLAWGATTALTFVYYLAVRGRYETAPCEAL